MTEAFKNLSDAMAQTVENLSPSVVRVDGRRRLPASGIIHSAEGIIITAHHILERDDDIRIGLADDEVLATLIGRDPHNDLAVLRVNASDLPAATWGADDALRVGNLVLALGRPADDVQATLGVISALVSPEDRRELRDRMRRAGGPRGKRRRRMMGEMGQALVDGFVRTDVTMYPGFSGGPLVGGDGAVYGLNTSGFRRGSSIAVPVTTIRNTVATLLQHGRMRQGFLGIGLQPAKLPEALVEDLEQETGLLVVSVESDSPAQTAGVMVGDTVVTFDGQSVEQLDDLLALLQGERVGQTVAMEIVRAGQRQTLSVTIAERM